MEEHCRPALRLEDRYEQRERMRERECGRGGSELAKTMRAPTWPEWGWEGGRRVWAGRLRPDDRRLWIPLWEKAASSLDDLGQSRKVFGPPDSSDWRSKCDSTGGSRSPSLSE